MRAGLLRETVAFSHLTKTQSTSGAPKTEYVHHLTTRCQKRKLSAVAGNVNASEIFDGNTVVLQVRYNPSILETDRVAYAGRMYSINLLDRQVDNTYLITLIKINS